MRSAGDTAGYGAAFSRPLALICGVLWIALMSAPLKETDAYRYAALILIAGALVSYARDRTRLPVGWLAWLCIGWGVYAAARFLWVYLTFPGHPVGASGWLYVFPLFFPPLGLALYLFRNHVERTIAAFFALALTMLVATTQFGPVLAGETVKPLIHHNQIHGAVGCGFLVVGAFYWLLHCLGRRAIDARMAYFAMAVAPPVIALALFGIYGAKSKGVWLAMVIVLPLMALSLLAYMSRGRALVTAAALGAIFAVAVFSVHDNLWKIGGPTFLAAENLVWRFFETGDIGNNLAAAISSGKVPNSMNERLRLWSNAWEILSANPFFGAGSLWIEQWKQTAYPDVGYTLIHNGYLEILIRHGLFGMAVFAVILFTFLGLVYRASRDGIIGRSALICYNMMILFYMLTLLSNSNNRLALGESFVLLIAAVAFFCYEVLERNRRAKERAGQSAQESP